MQASKINFKKELILNSGKSVGDSHIFCVNFPINAKNKKGIFCHIYILGGKLFNTLTYGARLKI
jgi:hypothetical protein